MERTRSYQAYLLRLWQESPTSEWRASLQPPDAAPLHSFADIDLLIAFLLNITQAPNHVHKTSAHSSLNPEE